MAEAPTPAEDPRDAAAGIEAARLDLRQVGYCLGCGRLVQRAGDGGCVNGHPSEVVFGRLLLDAEEPTPSLGRFNVAAFAMPPVWGPAHGQWAGAFFLPIWLFADTILGLAVGNGAASWIGAVAVWVATLGFQYHFASTANGQAWRRICARACSAEDVTAFRARQRVWAWVCVPLGAALLGWGIYYRIVLA